LIVDRYATVIRIADPAGTTDGVRYISAVELAEAAAPDGREARPQVSGLPH